MLPVPSQKLALENVDHIVHLAGAKFYNGKPLTEERKAISRNSRVGAIHLLLEELKANGQRHKSFISASTAGYYDFSHPAVLDENSPKANTFNADLYAEWEAAADEFKKQQMAERVIKVRISAVLANNGGLLHRLMTFYQTNAALLSSQRMENYMPWIHIDDLIRLLSDAISSDKYNGVYNANADEPINLNFISLIRHCLT